MRLLQKIEIRNDNLFSLYIVEWKHDDEMRIHTQHTPLNLQLTVEYKNLRQSHLDFKKSSNV